MQAFLIGLQFLTRIKFVRQTAWTDQSFGASVTYFPLVGMTIGAFLVLIWWVLTQFLPFSLPPFTVALFLVMAEFLITGGLHADGLMDTCDGYFSGRDRDRSLAIMKDSRVGSNGVIAFVFLVLIKIALYISAMNHLFLLLWTLPTVSRWAMTYTITHFPYARPQGIGKAFAEFAPSYTFLLATLLVVLPVLWTGWRYLFFIPIGWLWSLWCNKRFVAKLGGVTGDTYGAIAETSEVVMLLSWVLAERMGLWII